MLSTPLLSSNLGAAVSQVAARVRASVAEVHSRGGSGSGTLWRVDERDGMATVVTNHHVLPGERASVTLEDGRRFEGRVVARDSRNDVAALQVELHGRDVPLATIGDARHLRAGDLVLAVGNPAGVRGAVTIGVVHRALPPSHPGRGRELVQADVLLGPGSSGGPLTDARGRVVGINAMVGGGMALAVPSHVVTRLLGRFGRFGKEAERPRLGVSAQEVPLPAALAANALSPASASGVASGSNTAALPDVARARHSKVATRETRSALLLTGVEVGSAADRAGALLGDLLYAVDGFPVEGGAGLLNALDGHLEGPVALSVLRGGVPLELAVTLDGGSVVPERELALAA